MNDSLLIYIRKNVPIKGVLLQTKPRPLDICIFLTNSLPLLLFFNSVSYKDFIKRSDLDAFKKLVVLRKIKSTNEFVPRWYSLFNWLNLFTNDFNCVHHDVKCWTVLGIRWTPPISSTTSIPSTT